MPEKIKTLKIDPNKCLRNDLTTAETENLIFVSSSDSTNNQPKRLLFHNPFQPFKYISIYLFCESIIIPYEEQWVREMGLSFIHSYIEFHRIFPFAELMGFSQNMCFNIAYALLLTQLTQFEFRYNPFNVLNERTLGVLQMISGSVPPIRLGLTNEQQIRRLVKITKFSLKIIRYLYLLWFPVFILVIMKTIFSVNSPLTKTFPFGISNAILFIVWTTHIVAITVRILFTIWINCIISYLKSFN